MTALLASMKELREAYNKSISEFNQNIERQLEVHESLLFVHKDIMKNVQDMSVFMSEVPDLLISIEAYSRRVSDTYNGYGLGFNEIQEKLDKLLEKVTGNNNE
ncbi:MAG: hypothetical protein V3V19_11205 [Cocleimonas sp.]